MNFVPNPGKLNKNNFLKDKNKFYRRIILKSHFGNDGPAPYMGYKNKANPEWLPKEIHHSVKTFIESMDRDLQKEPYETTQGKNPNLTKGEIQSMNNLKEREDIIITKADKGGAVVIMNVDDYLKEAKRQLNDTEFYRKVDADLTDTHTDIVNDTIKKFVTEKLLDEHVAKALTVDDPKTAKFYMLPKVHKEGVPGRPITNAIGSPTSTIAEFVDFQLQPMVNQLRSYIKDTTDFLNKISHLKNIPKDSILVTMDVKSLYTNIPHNEGINAVAQSLEGNDQSTCSTRMILKFLSLILNLNNFTFNDENYLQIKGCAMGSKCSSSYADIFMGKFEKEKIYPLIKGKALCYYRFRDDIFMIWTAGENSLKKFFSDINKVHTSIKFDCKYSKQEISFLDTTVILQSNGTLSTKLYRKPTDRNAYLHFNSYHPVKQKENIPFGQFLRAKKICSSNNEADISFQDIEAKFKMRGYPSSKLKEQRRKAELINREELLQEKNGETGRKIPFTTTFNKHLPSINPIIEKHWHLLKTNPEIASKFCNKPVLAFRRNKNLRDILGQTHLSKNKKIVKKKPPTGGSSQACLSRANNQCCMHIISTKTFKSHITNEMFDIKHKLNCHSRNVIYLGFCNICRNSQYVGKSEPPANLRINTHRFDVKSPKGGRFDKHFNLPGHDYNKNARYILIEQVKQNKMSKKTIRQLLEEREDYWMTKLKTVIPNGLNDHLNSNVNNQIRVICS